ncbi:MAG: hypothetical protein WCE49_04435 [Terrimicrobiaceae bacterium]
MTDTGPVYDRKAVEKWYADVFEVWRPKSRVGDAPDTLGGVVWEAGEWSETSEGETGDPIQIGGYWSALSVREGDDWKIRMLAYNKTAAPPPA